MRPAHDFTPQEIAWARSQLPIRDRERLSVELGRAPEWSIKRARHRRAREAGLSRARHRELIRFVERDAR